MPATPPTSSPDYLRPYLSAAAVHGAGFASLLWAGPQTQAARFDAVTRLCNLNGRSLLDVGCGRADLLAFLLNRRIIPCDYTGIEAVTELAVAAEQNAAKSRLDARIVRADFMREPARLFVGADVVVISGSLNTIDDAGFYRILERAYDATASALVFNFLASPQLAGAEYLFWRKPSDVLKFVRGLTDRTSALEDYLKGDCTVAIWKKD